MILSLDDAHDGGGALSAFELKERRAEMLEEVRLVVEDLQSDERGAADVVGGVTGAGGAYSGIGSASYCVCSSTVMPP